MRGFGVACAPFRTQQKNVFALAIRIFGQKERLNHFIAANYQHPWMWYLGHQVQSALLFKRKCFYFFEREGNGFPTCPFMFVLWLHGSTHFVALSWIAFPGMSGTTANHFLASA